MRDQLLGYLLDALEPHERAAVEEELARRPQLAEELAVVRSGVQPLEADREQFAPPAGLARRTCEFVLSATTSARSSASRETVGRQARWTLTDIAVAAGLFLAACTLLIPALNHSRWMSRLTACQNNLRQLGMALTGFGERNGGLFPQVAPRGNFSAAGIYAPRLVDAGYLKGQPQAFVCPSSKLADEESFQMPTLIEIRDASGRKLAEYQRVMGGSYGYNFGYVAGGRYFPTRNLHRANFALMADAPSDHLAERTSANHGGCGFGQNVLCEDGHVGYYLSCRAPGNPDDIFLNDAGLVAAGLHRDDAVVAPSAARPFIVPASATADPRLFEGP